MHVLLKEKKPSGQADKQDEVEGAREREKSQDEHLEGELVQVLQDGEHDKHSPLER